jgi:hypothetical protein
VVGVALRSILYANTTISGAGRNHPGFASAVSARGLVVRSQEQLHSRHETGKISFLTTEHELPVRNAISSLCGRVLVIAGVVPAGRSCWSKRFNWSIAMTFEHAIGIIFGLVILGSVTGFAYLHFTPVSRERK